MASDTRFERSAATEQSRKAHSFLEEGRFGIKPVIQRQSEATIELQQCDDELLAAAEQLQRPKGNGSSSQATLPELPPSTELKLNLKWIALKKKYHLDGADLHWNDKVRQRPSIVRQRDHIRILSTVNVAGYWFTDLAYAYWSIWNPATRHEVFVSWLDAIRGRVSSDIENVWKEKSVDGWYTKTCNHTVQMQLDARVREWTKKARGAELAHQEAHSKTVISAIQSRRVETGNRAAPTSEGEGPKSAPGHRVPVKRGRPPTLSDERKAAAQEVKNEGRSNRDAAAVLYDVKFPSRKQVTNVSSILGRYRKKTAARQPISDENSASGTLRVEDFLFDANRRRE